MVHADLPPPTAPTLRWQPGEREEWAELPVRVRSGLSDDWAGAVADAVRESWNLRYDALEVLAVAPPELVRPHLAGFTPEFVWDAVPALRRILARCGGDAAAFALRVARKRPSSMAAALLPVEGAEVAVQMADWLVRARSVRPVARAWLERNHASAVRDLVPVALGKPGRARAAAEEALRLLDEAGHRDAVRAAASRYGDEAAAAVDAVLDLDPLDRLPARIPARPDWLDPAHLPPVLLADRSAALPASAVGHLCTVLALCAPGETYPGADVVKAATDPASLAELAWALFERWRGAGFPSRDGWVLEALALCGDDETVRGLAPLVRAWPGEGGHARAVAGLDVLAAIGTDVALMHLHGIAEKVEVRGPADAGPGEDRRGRRRPRPERRAAGRPAGPRLRPRPRRLDGPRLRARAGSASASTSSCGPSSPTRTAPGARRCPSRRPRTTRPSPRRPTPRSPALKKDVKTIAATRSAASSARWSAAAGGARPSSAPCSSSTRCCGTSPAGWSGPPSTTPARSPARSALAEDRTPADAEDDAITLADDTTVGIAHPLHLGEQLGAWSELFADYEILQPFPQLGRDTHAPDPAGARGPRVLHRLEGVHGPDRPGARPGPPRVGARHGHGRRRLDGRAPTGGRRPAGRHRPRPRHHRGHGRGVGRAAGPRGVDQRRATPGGGGRRASCRSPCSTTSRRRNSCATWSTSVAEQIPARPTCTCDCW